MVIVLLIVLGWNELIYVLSNPLLLMLVVTLGSGLYAVYILGLLPFIMPVANAAWNQVMMMLNGAVAGAAARATGPTLQPVLAAAPSSSPARTQAAKKSKKDE